MELAKLHLTVHSATRFPQLTSSLSMKSTMEKGFTQFRSASKKSAREIDSKSIRAAATYVQCSVAHKVVGKTNGVVVVDYTANWDDQVVVVPVLPQYLESGLDFQVLEAGDIPIGEARVPFHDFLRSGDKIRYPMMSLSGKVNGELIISHKFSLNHPDVDLDAGNDEVAPVVENKKSGFAKRFAERVAASALVSAVKEAICCLISAAQE